MGERAEGKQTGRHREIETERETGTERMVEGWRRQYIVLVVRFSLIFSESIGTFSPRGDGLIGEPTVAPSFPNKGKSVRASQALYRQSSHLTSSTLISN
jgi:hypothetical protein